MICIDYEFSKDLGELWTNVCTEKKTFFSCKVDI